MAQVRIENATLEVIRGDISEQDVEAIVNAANNHLWMGAGVAGAIKRAGGPRIEQEAVAQGPIPVGEAVVTTAGRLKARYVIHAAGMGQDLHTNSGKVEQATKNSLKRAEEKGIRSVAFPAIGTGVGGFPVGECARVMIGAAADHLATTSCIERVVFVLFDQAGYEVFLEQVKNFSSS